MENNKAGKYITLSTLKHFKDVENQLTDSKINNIKKITGSEVKYIASTSATTPPGINAAWQTTIPTLQADEYLWTRTEFKYSDGTSEYLYSVGSKGPKGDIGDAAFYITIENDFDSVPCSTSGVISDSYDYEEQTKHKVRAYLGDTPLSVKVLATLPAKNEGFVLVYVPKNITFQGSNRITSSDSAYEAYVTNLTADAGYVQYTLYKDIIAVAQAKFEIAKLYAGEQGNDAVDYWIEASDSQVVRDKTGAITPNSITVNFKKQVGQGTISDYTGSYEYIVDGDNSTKKTGNASSITFNSTTLGSANKKISLKLFLKGTSTVVDTETISFVTDGQDGTPISKVTEYYLATDLASGVTTSTAGWVNVSINPMPQISASKPYLWNYEVITIGSEDTATDPALIGKWSEDGEPGEPGAEGRGIQSITEYYLATSASSGVTTSTSGWTTTIQTTTQTNKYLWNYEVITYTKGSPATSTTTPVIIGTHGTDGKNGNNGNNGKNGSSVGYLYHADTSSNYSTKPTSISDSKWSSTILTPTAAKPYVYVSAYTNNDGIYTFTTPALYSSLDGLISILEDDGIALISKVNNKYYLKADQINGAMSDNVTIAGFNINNTSLYNGITSMSDSTHTTGVYLGTDGIRLGQGFSVDTNGNLNATNATLKGIITATGGAIGSYTIEDDKLANDNASLEKSKLNVWNGNNSISLDASGRTPKIQFTGTSEIAAGTGSDRVGFSFSTAGSSNTRSYKALIDCNGTGGGGGENWIKIRIVSAIDNSALALYQAKSFKVYHCGWDYGVAERNITITVPAGATESAVVKFGGYWEFYGAKYTSGGDFTKGTAVASTSFTQTQSTGASMKVIGGLLPSSTSVIDRRPTLLLKGKVPGLSSESSAKYAYQGSVVIRDSDTYYTWSKTTYSAGWPQEIYFRNLNFNDLSTSTNIRGDMLWYIKDGSSWEWFSGGSKNAINDAYISSVDENGYSVSTKYVIGADGNRWAQVHSVLFYGDEYYRAKLPISATVSDAKLKNSVNYDISEYDVVFDELKPVSFKYNDGTSDRRHLGLMAQDLQKTLNKNNMSRRNFAALVIGGEGFDSLNDEVVEEDNVTYGINYTELHALEIRQIQLLKEEIKQLKEEINNLKENS